MKTYEQAAEAPSHLESPHQQAIRKLPTWMKIAFIAVGAGIFGSVYTGVLVWAFLRPGAPLLQGCKADEIRLYSQTVRETTLTCLPRGTKLLQKGALSSGLERKKREYRWPAKKK